MPEYEAPTVLFEGILEPECGSRTDFLEFELDDA